jgi:hypothetical protein
MHSRDQAGASVRGDLNFLPMSQKLQIPHSIKALYDAVVTHLDRFESTNRDDFNYGRESERFGIEYFHLYFARAVSIERNGKPNNLGFIRLRRLNTSLTEMVIEDSPSLEVGPDLFLGVRFWEEDYEELQKMPMRRLKAQAAAKFQRFRTLHQEVREAVIEGLKEDHLLLGEEKVAVTPPNKSDDTYVDKTTIARLRQVRSSNFDLQRLIRLCEELNKCSAAGTFCATAALVRAVIDHVPPIFGARTFAEVANNVGEKSIKASLLHLETSSRNIADSVLHQQIRKREVIPNRTQVNFSNDLEVLLGEVVRRLS